MLSKEILLSIQKGDHITIDRFRTGIAGFYTVSRVCKRHLNIENKQGKWAMPNYRKSDILSVIKSDGTLHQINQ